MQQGVIDRLVEPGIVGSGLKEQGIKGLGFDWNVYFGLDRTGQLILRPG